MNLDTILESHKNRPRQKQCKYCRVRYKYHGETDGFCSDKCRKDLAKEKDNKRKEREKERKARKKEKIHESIKYLQEKADKTWAKLVKIKYGYKCAYCGRGKGEVQLHSHHIFTRVRHSTRLDTDNGICLCASHHKLDGAFSAHQTGIEFTKWIYKYKGDSFMEILEGLSNEILHVTPEYLKERTKEMEEETRILTK